MQIGGRLAQVRPFMLLAAVSMALAGFAAGCAPLQERFGPTAEVVVVAGDVEGGEAEEGEYLGLTWHTESRSSAIVIGFADHDALVTPGAPVGSADVPTDASIVAVHFAPCDIDACRERRIRRWIAERGDEDGGCRAQVDLGEDERVVIRYDRPSLGPASCSVIDEAEERRLREGG